MLFLPSYEETPLVQQKAWVIFGRIPNTAGPGAAALKMLRWVSLAMVMTSTVLTSTSSDFFS